MLVEYELAASLGRAWLRVRPGLERRIGDLPDRCRAVAHDHTLSARQLWQAQDFAVRVWWRFGAVLLLACFPVAGVAAAVRPGPAGRATVAALIAVLAGAAFAAVAQAGMIRYRSDRTRLYSRKHRAKAEADPLPPGSAGIPRRSDFWIVLAAVLVVYAILLAIALTSAH